MPIILLATGILAGGATAPAPADFPTPAARTVTLARDAPRLSQVAAGSVDPSGRIDFAFKMGALLDEGEAFTAVEFTVVPEAVARGLLIVEEQPRQPAWLDPTTVRLWVEVDPAHKDNPAWQGQGFACGIEFTWSTDRLRTDQTTPGVKVLQK